MGRMGQQQNRFVGCTWTERPRACGKAKYAHFNKIENLKIDLATWQNKLMILHK
jgi:hypothetical protein